MLGCLNTFEKILRYFHADRLTQRFDVQNHPRLVESFGDDSLQSHQGARDHPHPITRLQTAMPLKRTGALQDFLNLSQFSDELNLVDDLDQIDNPLSPQNAESLLRCGADEQIAAEHRNERLRFSTSPAAAGGPWMKRQIKRNRKMLQLPGERLFIAWPGVDHAPSLVR
jgi:hypothetical protein